MLRSGTCLGTRRRLGFFLDNDLGEVDTARVRLHLSACRHCRDARRRLEATLSDLHLLAASPPPPARSVVNRVMALIRIESPPK
jgi:predicted anti-sigma-YlaC factor YlaD